MLFLELLLRNPKGLTLNLWGRGRQGAAWPTQAVVFSRASPQLL